MDVITELKFLSKFKKKIGGGVGLRGGGGGWVAGGGSGWGEGGCEELKFL